MPRQQRIVTDLSENSRHTFGLRMQARATRHPGRAADRSCRCPDRQHHAARAHLPALQRLRGKGEGGYPVTAMDSAAPVLRQPGEAILEEDPRITGFMKDYAERPDELKATGCRSSWGPGRGPGGAVGLPAETSGHPGLPVLPGPNFRVRVGDLRDRREAERLRSTLRADHPGCYIVPDGSSRPRCRRRGGHALREPLFRCGPDSYFTALFRARGHSRRCWHDRIPPW